MGVRLKLNNRDELMKKNTAGQVIGVQMTAAADGTPFAGTVTCQYTIDGGAQVAGAVVSLEANGFYTMPVNATISNGDHIAFTFIGTGAIASTVQVYTSFPQTVDNDTKITLAQLDLDTITSTDGVLIGQTALDAVWDEVLDGTHNVNKSAGKRLRQVDAAFTVHSGTAQAGTANTITLDALAEPTNDIYNGDRCIIVGGTGVEEHGLIIAYNGTTKVATMSENWSINPDATSEFELSPATVDVHTWGHNAVTGDGDWAALQADATAILLDTASGGIPKNAIFNDFQFPMVLASDHYTAATGLTVTGQRSIDGGAFTNVTGVIAEVGSGLYTIDLTAADTNGDTVSYKFSSATADDTIVPTIITRS